MIEIRGAETSDLPADRHALLADAVSRGSAMVAVDDDGPICFWGFLPDSLLGDSVYMWFEPVRELVRYKVRFLRANRKYLASVLAQYPVIYGSVDPARPKACVWLQWLGFKEIGTFVYEGRYYNQIELRA